MNKKILVVDDSPSIRRIVAAVLTEEGYDVFEAGDGIEALKLLQEMTGSESELGLIFADVNMPNMGGIEMIRKIKQTSFRYVPILVLTTESSVSKKMEGKEAGAAGWLVKPFTEEQLKNVVSRFLL